MAEEALNLIFLRDLLDSASTASISLYVIFSLCLATVTEIIAVLKTLLEGHIALNLLHQIAIHKS